MPVQSCMKGKGTPFLLSSSSTLLTPDNLYMFLSPRVDADQHSVIMQDAKFLGAYTPNAFIYASSKVRGASGLYAIGSRYSTGQVQPCCTPAPPTTSSTPNAHLRTMLEGREPDHRPRPPVLLL